MWHSRHASASTFPHDSLFRNMMIVLRRTLYGVFSDGHAFGLFGPLPTPVLIGFTQEANIYWKRILAKFCFSVRCSSGFTHGIKAT